MLRSFRAVNTALANGTSLTVVSNFFVPDTATAYVLMLSCASPLTPSLFWTIADSSGTYQIAAHGDGVQSVFFDAEKNQYVTKLGFKGIVNITITNAGGVNALASASVLFEVQTDKQSD